MIENRSDISHKIIAEVYKAVEKIAPGEIDLLCLLGSYGDTQEDEDILSMFEDYNEHGSIFKEVIFDKNGAHLTGDEQVLLSGLIDDVNRNATSGDFNLQPTRRMGNK